MSLETIIKLVRNSLLTIVIISFVSLSCSRKEWETEVESINLPFTGVGKYYDVLVDQSDRIHIVGGDRFSRNDFFQSNDNGNTWEVTHFNPIEYSNKAIFSIAEHKGSLYAGSFDGKVFKNTTGSNADWVLGMGQAWWFALTGIAMNENDLGLTVGSSSIHTGIILKFNENLDLLQTDTFPFAVNDVAFLNNDIAYAVGYGALLQTKDAGATWKQLNLTDDNYRSVFIIDKDNIWTVGFNGTIAHITNNGADYKKIKNGQNPFSNSDRYIDIAFKGKDGYIVGDAGVVLQTTDGGANWKRMKKFTQSDLRAVSFHPHANTVFFVGDSQAAFKYTP